MCYLDMGAGATMFSLLGKGFSTAGFTSIFVYSAELYPTEVRNVGMGTSSMISKIGSIVAPFIAPVFVSPFTITRKTLKYFCINNGRQRVFSI